MVSALYLEIYLICIVIVSLLLHWSIRSGSDSASEQCLRRMLWVFFANFAANLLFTVFNGLRLIPGLVVPASYLFKSLYFLTLSLGVFAWCQYAQTTLQSAAFNRKLYRLILLPVLLLPVAVVGLNLKNHMLFEITAEGRYDRHIWFHYMMGYLVCVSMFFSLPLIKRIPYEFENNRKSQLWLTASFSLCLLIAWIVSNLGEAFPVMCVCIAIDLLCMYMDSSTRQISLDKLTQVNNRQNLLSFLEYKLLNHDESLFLLMMDVDYFKTINDTYGHLEGDEALIHVAKVLKNTCGAFTRRPYIARYGGDEFMILVEGSRAECDKLRDDIQTNLKAMCETLHKPYTLTLSIGVARWEPSMSAKDFIESADNQLYEIKRNRPPRH
ncbi:MAG: GGDEF domain-containing protein [Clostridia bacterium]|nr:GGDEF domain-containing protein [Clostridia bacterium]